MFNLAQIQFIMSRILLFLSVTTLSLIACQSDSNTLKIKGSADLTDNSILYHIVADNNNQPKILDTIKIDKGVFELNTQILEPEFHFIQIEGQGTPFPFIAENGTVSLEIYKDSIGLSKATGTVSNDDFMRYKSETKVYIESLNGIGNDLQQALILKDSLLAQDLQEQYQEVRVQIQDYELEFLKAAPNSLLSILILERFIANKIIPNEEAKTLYNGLSDRIKNTKSGKVVKQQVEQAPKAEVGQLAPEFEGPSPDGNSLALKNSLGKITIIDFWASWCRPCRIENPNLVQLYQKNKSKGLKIVGVSLDKEKNKWIKAIEDDGLTWSHVSNLQFWNDPIAKLYKVTAIPATFLLDENGVIIAKNLRGIELYNKVEALLNQM